MALTEKQTTELNIANKRVEAAKAAGSDLSGLATDIKNLEYARTKGFTPTIDQTTPAPAVIPTTEQVEPAAPTPAAAPTRSYKFGEDVVDVDTTTGEKVEPTPEPTAKVEPTEPTPAGEGVEELVASGRVFNETDAKNYAYAQGDKNFQQYIGGTAGQANSLYIGSTNWARLQQQYTPYQLERATTRTKDGIYWNPEENIGDIPRVDPADLINTDSQIIANLVSDAKDDADKMISDKAKDKGVPDLSSDVDENNNAIMKMLQGQYGNTAESLYEELYKTPEMETAQGDVMTQKTKLDEFDQQLEELKDDIRAEVEGEASAGYINAKAAIRGGKILRLKRQTQRDYDSALGVLNGLKDEANNLLSVRTKDADTRYNRLFSMLQVQQQEEGREFNQDLAMFNAMMQIPAGRTMTIGDKTVKGLNENANLNVIQYTDGQRNTYVIGVDKATGEQKYKTFIGKGAGAAAKPQTFQEQYKEFEAKTKLEQLKQVTGGLQKTESETGAIRTSVDENGDTFYYDSGKYSASVKEDEKGWTFGDMLGDPKEEDFLLFYAK